MINECENLIPSILRPGPVYRAGIINNLLRDYGINSQPYRNRKTGEQVPGLDLGVNGTRLDVLSEIIIEEATKMKNQQ